MFEDQFGFVKTKELNEWLDAHGFQPVKRKRNPRTAKRKRIKYMWYKRPTWGTPLPSTAAKYGSHTRPTPTLQHPYGPFNDLDDYKEAHERSMVGLRQDADKLGIHFPNQSEA